MSEQAFIALGTINDFREGRAIIPFIQKPHYWIVEAQDTTGDIHIYRSRCGQWASLEDAQSPIVPGNFHKCKRCQRSVDNALAYTDSAGAARKAKG